MKRLLAAAVLLSLPVSADTPLPKGTEVQARMEADAKAGKPLVAHVVVALCDNKNQRIAKVPEELGNGQDPKSNLYWGALYGVRTYLLKHGWESVPHKGALPDGVLDRIVLHRKVTRPGKVQADAYIVAEAWDGKKIRTAIDRFLHMAGGHEIETLELQIDDKQTLKLPMGGNAHVLAFVGHDGLMEFPVPEQPKPVEKAPARSAIVLACSSRDYFKTPLADAQAHALLLTTHLMAPEAYTLDATLTKVFSGGTPEEVHEAAATAYDKYQKCGIKGARAMFISDP